jgi:6-phosphogluconolactonase (cycloisomerase 2 family)
MQKLILFGVLVMGCGVINPVADAASTITIFSDLNGTATPGGYIIGQYSPGNSFVIGAAFTPIRQTYTLSQIQALLSFGSGVNSMVLSLHQDSGGVPGELLESWSLDDVLGTAPSIITLDSVRHPTLRAGQQYWITAAMVEPTSVGVWWINYIGGACCGSPEEVQGISTGSHNGGPFTPGTPTGVGFHAFAVTGVPEARTFVYVANRGSGNISVYAMNPTIGTLTPLRGSPFSSAVGTPNALAVHPTGKFLYVAPFGGRSVEAFSIDTGGALTPVPGSPFATDSGAISVAVDPTGRFAYVANLFADDVSGFTINQSTGALTPISGSPFPSGSWPHGVTVDPLGRFAYVTNCGDGQGCDGAGPGSVSEYTINPVTGALTVVSGSPVAAELNPMSVTVDPTGRFVYVPNPGSGDVSAFTITPSVGSLTQIPGSPFLTGGQPFSVAIDPADRFAYINAACCKSVSGFRIDPASGALTAIGTFPAGTVPQSPAVDLTGKFLYVPDALSDDVFGYAINSSTGALTRVGTIPTGTNPVWVAITAPALSKRFGPPLPVVPPTP